MRRNILVLIFFFVGLLYATAQNQLLGNEWINYQQTYIKIPIAQTGIYKITAADLKKTGVNFPEVNPVTFQLFHRGIEQAIYIESDSLFNDDDFLEFYGRGNDGAADSLLYRPTSAQPHTYYSLFSDTTAYFLTWRLDGKPGKRMATYTDSDGSDLIPESYHWAEELRLFTDTYPGWASGIPPKIEYSHFEEGEGYTGAIQRNATFYDNTFSITNSFRNGPVPQLDVLLAGREYIDHVVKCQVGPSAGNRRKIDSVAFAYYNNARIAKPLHWSDVGADGRLIVSTMSTGVNSGTDAYSVSSIRLRYPQRLVNNQQAFQTYQLIPNATRRSLLTIEDSPANTRFWDISDPNAPIRIGVANQAENVTQLIVHDTYTSRKILRTNQFKTVPNLLPVTFQNFAERRPTYLIISHESLMKPANGFRNAVQAYAAYRASETGGQHDTLTVSIQQLFDQYSYGERHPLAIRRFADQLLRQSQHSDRRPQYLFLMGHSRSAPGVRRNPDQASIDLVMTAGFPGSDLLFTAGLDGYPQDVPAIPTGRLNVTNSQQIIDYLNKVREFEALPSDQRWRKRILHLSGGTSPGEATLFKSLLNEYATIATTEALGAQIKTLAKQTNNLVEPINVAKEVNEGVGLMTFFGHSSLDVSDLDIGFCSNDALGYANKGKYPLMLINGCASGNIFYSRPTFSSDWVITPNRGAIAAIANSHLAYTDVLNRYSQQFYSLLTDSSSLYKSIGELQQETVRRVLTPNPTGLHLANAQQMVLQGDPAIHLFPFKTPDYAITASGISIRDLSNQSVTALSDSVRLSVVIDNYGQYQCSALPIRIRRLVDDREQGVYNLVLPQATAYQDTVTFTLPNDHTAIGLNWFEITINPTNSIHERNHSNNQASVNFTVSNTEPILIYPPSSGTVQSSAIQLVAYYLPKGIHTFDVELDTSARFDSPTKHSQQIRAESIITSLVNLFTRAPQTYYWRVRLSDATSADWTIGQFQYDPTNSVHGLPEGQLQLVTALPADIRQGDMVAVTAQFTNLSPHPFSDSLTVQQTIYASNVAQPIYSQWRVKAPASGDTLRFTTRIATEKLPGVNRLLLTVNPHIQPEYSFINNTLDLPLLVQPDRLAPLIEVAIDGARIANNDYVSSRPIIDILVTDDNRALVRRDTVGLDLYLQHPNSTHFERLSWRNTSSQLVGNDNVFRIRYVSPTLPEGAYHLLATASDAIGNVASPYRISFQVRYDQTLNNLTVYPNPFRDQATFAFQITGDAAPASVNLTITDLAGRIVRKAIIKGRVGVNEWIWDGRSDSGELLPAGTYLYTLRIDASTGAAKRNGRIVLMR